MNPKYYLTAYEIAVKHGFRGTEEEWLVSLTAFYLARKAGFQGTEEAWMKLLIDPVPDIQIGNVITLEGGSDATAEIIGDKMHPILNLGIPRGLGMMDALPLVGGKMAGNIDMDSHNIASLPLPTENDHAAPKQYVDERLKKDGSEAMTGPLNMNGRTIFNLPTPTENEHAAPKQYVDERLKKDGSEAMTGPLKMDGHRISNLGDPVSGRDAVCKEYLESYTSMLRLTLTLPGSGWSASAPYTQTVTMDGVLSTDTPHWGIVYSDAVEMALVQKEAFAMVDDLDTADGSVTFTCFEDKPEVDLTIQLEVNR